MWPRRQRTNIVYIYIHTIFWMGSSAVAIIINHIISWYALDDVRGDGRVKVWHRDRRISEKSGFGRTLRHRCRHRQMCIIIIKNTFTSLLYCCSGDASYNKTAETVSNTLRGPRTPCTPVVRSLFLIPKFIRFDEATPATLMHTIF